MARLAEIIVRDLMRLACTVGNDTEISEAIRIMKAQNTDFLSVVDEKFRLIGAVGEHNLLRLVKHGSSTPMGDVVWFDSVEPEEGKRPIQTIMTTDISTISLDDNIKTVLHVMDSVGYRILHVVDSDRKLLGIVRMRDVFEKILGA
jgi:CBS-domain-containing membrane protein